jgi:hypothetical protein
MNNIKKIAIIVAMLTSFNAFADAIELSGFGSLYYAQTFDQNLLPNQFTSNKADFTKFSLFGLNLSAKANENATFYSQLIASGGNAQSDNFNLFAQWVFLNYKLSDTSHVKIGRQLFPAAMYSEYARVGYLLPASHMPSPYTSILPFISFDGLSYNQDIYTLGGKLNFGIYGGSPKINASSAVSTPTLYHAYGGQLNYDINGLRVRGTVTRWKQSVDFIGAFASLGTGRKAASTVYTVGLKYEKHNVVFWSEWMKRTSSDAYKFSGGTGAAASVNGKTLLEGAESGYALLGYQLGKWLPRVSYSSTNLKYGFSNGKVTSYNAGLNYGVAENVTLKLDYDRIVLPSAGGGYFAVTQPSGTGATKRMANAVFAGMDFIF